MHQLGRCGQQPFLLGGRQGKQRQLEALSAFDLYDGQSFSLADQKVDFSLRGFQTEAEYLVALGHQIQGCKPFSRAPLLA